MEQKGLDLFRKVNDTNEQQMSLFLIQKKTILISFIPTG